MSTSRRKVLRMAGAAAAMGAGGILTGCGSTSQRNPNISAHEANCPIGSQPPNPIEEFVCCTANGDFANEAGLPNPVEELETISTGYVWTEGPIWVGDENGYLMFSDVPGNGIYTWDSQAGTQTWLKPSGSQIFPTPFHVREDGTNGLCLGRGGLVAADCGVRGIVWFDMETKKKTILADRYNGKRFHSTNDLVIADNGDIYFTDAYNALNANYRESMWELDFFGVYRIDTENRVHLVADNLRPNGIALTPDNRTLVVTDRSGWVAIDLDNDGMPLRQRQFVSREVTGGGADGMQMDHAGRLWTTSTGGIHVFSPSAEHIGFIPVPNRRANCNFGADGYLYIANCDRMLRAKIKPEFA